MPGDGKVKEPKIRIARQEGLLCNPCYNEKTVAITRNTEIEPLTSEQGRNCCDLKEKVKQRTKWNVYSHRQRKRAFYKETAKSLGLLENPKEVIFWEGDENTGKWVTGEQLCKEGMITLYKGQGKGTVREELQGVIVRRKVSTREWNQEIDIIPVESSRMKLGDGMITVLVGKNGLPAKRLTGKVVFPNSTESKVRVSWFGRREEWKVVSQVVFGEEVTATERNKKMPERLTWDRQQETTVGELLKERSEAEEKEKAKAKKMEKKNSKYFKGAYNLIDFEEVVKVVVLGTDVTEIPDIEKMRISTLLAKGEYNLAYRKMCINKDNIDRSELLWKMVEKAMKQDGIECPEDNAEYERIRGVYKARLADKICLDREFINHDKNLRMFEISATFDMLRRNLPTFILPDLSVNIIDTIASISYCFVCKRNEICKFSYKEGLCHDCFNAKYDLKLCVVCNKKTTRGDCAKVAT